MNKIVLVVVLLLIITNILYGCTIKKNTPLSINDLFGENIETIKILEGIAAEPVEITDLTQKDLVLKSLMVEKWEPKKSWDIKLTPDLFVIIDDKVIGLFDSERNYAKLESINKIIYYKIPNNVYENIINFIQ